MNDRLTYAMSAPIPIAKDTANHGLLYGGYGVLGVGRLWRDAPEGCDLSTLDLPELTRQMPDPVKAYNAWLKTDRSGPMPRG